VKTPSKAYSIAFAGPILAGKEEPWRRFLQELAGSRSQEYGTLKQRLGILFRVQRGPFPTRSVRRISRASSGPISGRTQEKRDDVAKQRKGG
jgi:hypothetical protein